MATAQRNRRNNLRLLAIRDVFLIALLVNHASCADVRVGAGCFTFNSECRSRSCFGSTVLSESVITSVPYAVFGNAMMSREVQLAP
jgi:hypothetical protein